MSKEISTKDNQVKVKRKFKRNASHNRILRGGVTYSPLELLENENSLFWNSVHDGQIKEVRPDSILVSVAKNGQTIMALVKNEELFKKERTLNEFIRIYLEDVLEPKEGEIHLFRGSEIKAIDLDLLEKAQKAYKDHELVKAYVFGHIKGGYTCALFANDRDEAESGFGLRAFLPFTQTAIRKMEGLGNDEDHAIDVYITDLNPILGNIVISRRELLVNQRKVEQEAFFKAHKLYDIVSGVVSAVMPYGVFVSLGPVDAFLHISDITWAKKLRANDLPKVGESITGKIIGIDEENKKVKLSIKDLNADPWQNIDKYYRPGMEVMGTIVAFADFGAFLSLQDGVEGLVHLGEMTWSRIKHPSQHFKIGDQVKALVLRVDRDAKRISLSTKALEQSPVERLSGKFPVGTVLKTKIASIHDFGLFVELEKDTNGLVPRSEISWSGSEEPLEKSFSVGQEIEVAVLGYDSKRQRVSCSIKRLTEDPWPKWKNKYRRGSTHTVKVTSLIRNGAICELETGLTGFCPKNQLITTENELARPIIKEGESMEVVITQFESMHHRISLSQKAVIDTQTKKAYAEYLSEQNKAGSKTTLADAIKNIGIKINKS